MREEITECGRHFGEKRCKISLEGGDYRVWKTFWEKELKDTSWERQREITECGRNKILLWKDGGRGSQSVVITRALQCNLGRA